MTSPGFGGLDFTYDIPPSGILKRLSVLLAASIAWMAGKDALSLKDSRRMKGAFLSACLGEAAFVFRARLMGLAFFTVCQILLIIRNSSGFAVALKNAADMSKRRLLTAGISILCSYMAILLVSTAYRGFGLMTVAPCLYWSILNLSLLAGAAGYILGLLPERNGLLSLSGIFCFYCCDILVGLDAALEAGLPWLLANSLIWVFYIPALVLLAFSCYRYE